MLLASPIDLLQQAGIQKPETLLAALAVALTVATLVMFRLGLRPLAVFAYLCFVRPFLRREAGLHQDELEHFYKSQAQVYDSTRTRLLKGREQALQLAFAHVLALHPTQKKLVWVDVGGGTGYNIAYVDLLVKLSKKNFARVILVDLLPLLCAVARERLAPYIKQGIVEVVCADALSFNQVTQLAPGSVDLVTFLYLLSMIPTYFSAVDHVAPLINKETGFITVADFGVLSQLHTTGRVDTLGGLVGRHSGWIPRNFWRIWFEFDNVHLDASRRTFLEYRFGTVKSLNLVNRGLGNIPYYIWVGCDKARCALLVDRLNAHATELPYLVPSEQDSVVPVLKGHEAAVDNQTRGLPFPSIYYQKQIWRVYYNEMNPLVAQFNNQYIYAFTWEDPREDDKIIGFKASDNVLAITSAGDNLLHYATLPDPPRRLHGVDLNPAQNHLLELKLACFKAKLPYDTLWLMFGRGKCAAFRELLATELLPYMLLQALQFWTDKGERAFSEDGHGLYYDTGSTRWALKFAHWVFRQAGVVGDVERLCAAKTLEEQVEIWTLRVRPAIFLPLVGKLIVNNLLFLWKALGVPVNQANMINGSILDYIVDTLDPIVRRSLVLSDNYFYYLCLQACYSKDNCPEYLTQRGYDVLTGDDSPIENFRLHTDTLNEVLARVTAGTFTVIVIMDHMDWFDPAGTDAGDEVRLLYRALAAGGRVMLRLASVHPWYVSVFEEHGFVCEAAAVRKSGESIDRCNMYASTWVATKVSKERKMSRLRI